MVSQNAQDDEGASGRGSSRTSGSGSGSGSTSSRLLQTLVVLSLTMLQQKLASGMAASGSASATSLSDGSSAPRPATTTPNIVPSSQRNENDKDDDDSSGSDDDLLVTTHEEGDEDEEDAFIYDTLGDFPEEDASSENDILIVSAVDGSLVGLSKSTGDLIWKQTGHQSIPDGGERDNNSHENDQNKNADSHHHNNHNNNHNTSPFPRTRKETISEAPSLLQPLVTTSTTAQSFANRDWRTAAVPSLDGKTVYLTAHVHKQDRDAGSDHASEVTVTTSIPDLVRRAPFVDNRGRIYNGSRSSIAVAVDGTTGEILKVISTNGESLFAPDDPVHDEEEWMKEGSKRKVVWMGRVDHTISVHEPRSGHLDVSFSAAEIKSVRDMILGPDQQPPWEASTGGSHFLLGASNDNYADEDNLPEASPNSLWKAVATTNGDSSRHRMQQCSLVSTPGGNLAYRNPSSGKIEWVSHFRFDAPVAFALDADSGATVPVDIIPDAVTPSLESSKELLSKEISRQYNNLIKPITPDTPNDAKTSMTSQKLDPLVGSLPKSGQLFAMPLGLNGFARKAQLLLASGSGTASSSHSKPIDQSTSSTLLSSVVPVSGRSHSSFEHSSTALSSTNQRSCSQGSSNFPSCLVSSSTSLDGTMDVLFGRNRHQSKNGAEGNDQAAVVPFGQEDVEGESTSEAPRVTLQSAHKKYQKSLMILGSWLPPLLALIFVVSFELGRRKRQKDHVLGGTTISSDGSSSNANGGVIQVNHNVILGYGGHGTVVFEGMLEGRKVAVKRMLQAYHASADREISLLIESDGHPNVVRYFLKEVRGEFVYLALELCDLSLHELIGHVRATFEMLQKENWLEEGDMAIPNAIQTVLLQIATGIKHLHGLRIVHRDLKPANILLADSLKAKRSTDVQESVFEIFGQGHYVAKISDMGLGKQLMGQSSFGASAAGESSLRVQHGDGDHGENQSSVAGAGPGTVGWQAPEVMVMRMTASDTSVRSNDSASAGEFSNDCSPLDLSGAARTSRAVDIFSLGCIFYSTLVPGSHPFGEWYEREANIMHNKPDMEPLRQISIEAHDLVSSMIKRNPTLRPTAKQVCEHPYFWSAERRLLFLCDFSDRLETEGMGTEHDQSDRKKMDHTKVIAVERNAVSVVGTAWDTVLDEDLVSNVQRFRTYDPSSVRDLLRLIRNKYHHFEELPDHLKVSMGSKTDGLSVYFEKRFPALLVHCFNMCRDIVSEDDALCVKYSIPPAPKLKTIDLPTTTIPEVSPAEETSLPPIRESRGTPTDTHANEADEAEKNETVSTDESDDSSDGTAPAQPELSPESDAAEHDTAPVLVQQTSEMDLEGYSSLVLKDYVSTSNAGDVIVWECSTAAKTFNNRGWFRSDADWVRRTDASLVKKPNSNLIRCKDDPKFRTRLCNHWDTSMGTICPMRKKGKCVFAHGPVELRVKEAKRNRWGKLVDDTGDNKNPKHSGGEDTYGAARAIETERKQEGKWGKAGDKAGKGGKKTGSRKPKAPSANNNREKKSEAQQ